MFSRRNKDTTGTSWFSSFFTFKNFIGFEVPSKRLLTHRREHIFHAIVQRLNSWWAVMPGKSSSIRWAIIWPVITSSKKRALTYSTDIIFLGSSFHLVSNFPFFEPDFRSNRRWVLMSSILRDESSGFGSQIVGLQTWIMQEKVWQAVSVFFT